MFFFTKPPKKIPNYCINPQSREDIIFHSRSRDRRIKKASQFIIADKLDKKLRSTKKSGRSYEIDAVRKTKAVIDNDGNANESGDES